LLEQLPRERLLGVVLNRADIRLDDGPLLSARQLRLALTVPKAELSKIRMLKMTD
jgi:hypothetical protein